jgi:hypothetical protein
MYALKFIVIKISCTPIFSKMYTSVGLDTRQFWIHVTFYKKKIKKLEKEVVSVISLLAGLLFVYWIQRWSVKFAAKLTLRQFSFNAKIYYIKMSNVNLKAFFITRDLRSDSGREKKAGLLVQTHSCVYLFALRICHKYAFYGAEHKRFCSREWNSAARRVSLALCVSPAINYWGKRQNGKQELWRALLL